MTSFRVLSANAMFILLLPAIFIVVFLNLTGYHFREHTPWADWRMAFLQSATLIGGYMVLMSELLSLFHALTTLWVAIFWGLALGVAIFMGWKTGWLNDGFKSLKGGWKKPGWFDILAGVILATILGLLFIVSIKSPVNNNDSLQYHMSRVMHWVQDQGLEHYATSFLPQLFHPILAELAILNLRLLTNNDLFANLIQWLSMVGVLTGVTALAYILGARKIGQWASVAFVVSLPTGILEASSTQNDYVVAFWMICLLYFIFRAVQIQANIFDIVTIGIVLGMGMLTKGTFYPYAAAPLVFLMVSLFIKYKPVQTMKYGLFIGLVAITINLGVWSRNFSTFDNPLGPAITTFTANGIGPGQIISGVTRNIAQNLATPNDQINEQIVLNLKSILSQIDPEMKSFNMEWGWNHEDLAGNPLHTFLILGTLIILIVYRKRLKENLVWYYLLVVVCMYILLASIVKYDVYGNRYQLPFFTSWAPIFGIAISLIGKTSIKYTVTIFLLLAAFPWVLFNRTRPLIAMRESNDPYTIPCMAGCTTGSILIEPPEKTMFAVWGTLGDAYDDAMKQVKETGCQEIGLKLDSNDLEYAYWWLLGAPQNGMRLDSIATYPELERYLDPNFKPCAIICTTCGDQPQLFGLERIGSFGDGRIKIYSGGLYDSAQP
jgi:hypothetical protein